MKGKYVVHGVILILLPTSVFAFICIVLLKLLCFFFTDPRRKQSREAVKAYGEFNDEDGVDEEVVSVYFKIMEKVVYYNPDNDSESERGKQSSQAEATQYMRH